MRTFYLALAGFLATNALFAQVNCGQHIIENQLRSEDPEFDAYVSHLDSISVIEAQSQLGKRAETIIIPVVFHVIHLGGDENINDDQIHSAIRLLNEDFNAQNAELDDIVPSFQNRIGNGEVEFRLATLDPSGNPTNGIDRIESTQTNVGTDASKLNPWPRSRYYNIWTTDAIGVGNAAAYAYRPGTAPSPGVDGVISNHRYVGNIGTASSNDGKTISHESAHWFNLIHTWGSSNNPGCNGSATNPNDPCFGIDNCDYDDLVGDTPNTRGTTNNNCNLSQSTCGSLDNVQNIMDYSDCDAMFTEGQVARFRAAMNSSTGQRNNLSTSNNLDVTGLSDLSEARYYVERSSVCRGETVQFMDESRYDPDSWSWKISGPENFSSTDQHPVFTFGTPGVYTVELTVKQGTTTKTIIDENAFSVSDVFGAAVPFMEDFSEPMEGWMVDVNESYSEYSWELSPHGNGDAASYMVNNVGNEDRNVKDLIFSSIDFRSMTSVSLSFDVAYGRFSSGNADELKVSFSDDCGDTWKTLWTGNSNQLNGSKPNTSSVLIPDEDDWESITINNVPLVWLSERTLVRFQFVPGGGNQLYLDNINFDGDYDNVPRLVYPLDESTDRSNDVTLDWRAVPGTGTYEYELSTTSSFSSLEATGTTTAIGDASDLEDTRFKTTDLSDGTTYFWRVRADNGSWSDAWSFTVDENGVGIDQAQSTDEIEVYPNPADDLLHIVAPQVTENMCVSVINVSGQLINRQNFTSNNQPTNIQISTGNLPSGAYLLRVETENKMWNQRFVINH